MNINIFRGRNFRIAPFAIFKFRADIEIGFDVSEGQVFPIELLHGYFIKRRKSTSIKINF
jgi:hypothetical protein